MAVHYAKEAELGEKEEIARTIKQELGGSVKDASKIDGILLLEGEEGERRSSGF